MMSVDDEVKRILKSVDRHALEIQKLQSILSMALQEIDKLHKKIVILSVKVADSK